MRRDITCPSGALDDVGVSLSVQVISPSALSPPQGQPRRGRQSHAGISVSHALGSTRAGSGAASVFSEVFRSFTDCLPGPAIPSVFFRVLIGFYRLIIPGVKTRCFPSCGK